MDQHEEFQDVDISILPETEQPRPALEASDALPHFQFLDGKGAVQTSTERPIEGFVALKMTYEHVFRKQQGQNRQLQERNRQLNSKLQHLLHDKQSKGSLENSVECTRAASSPNDSLQIETLESSKNKLRYGLIRLARCLLKRESSSSPLSDVLRKIIGNLQSLECDSEESLKYLSSLFDEIEDWDELIQWGKTTEFKVSSTTSKDASMTMNVAAPGDASLQKLINSYQQVDTQSRQDVMPKARTKQQTEVKGQLAKVKPQMVKSLSNEDMYGPDVSVGEKDLVPYNVVRLHKKMRKLQEFPVIFGSIVQSLESRRSFDAMRSALSEIPTDTSTQRSASRDQMLATTPDEIRISDMPSFHVPPIKMPPDEYPAEASGKDDDGTGLGTNMRQVHHARSTPPRRFTAQNSPGTSISGTVDVAQSDFDVLSLEQPRNPPSVSSQTLYDSDQFTAYPNTAYYANPFNFHVPQMFHSRIQPENKTNDPPFPIRSVASGNSTGGSSDREKPESTTRHVSASAPARLDPAGDKMPNPIGSDLDELALGTESPYGPYMPTSRSDTDQLVTAHSTDLSPTKNSTQMECPVCQQKFPPDTLEQTVLKHVNLHFDEALKNDSFEILSN